MSSQELETNLKGFPPRLLIPCEGAVTISDNRLRWLPLDIGELRTIHASLETVYADRLTQIDQVLQARQKIIFTRDQAQSKGRVRSDGEIIRETIKALFPILNTVIKRGEEEVLFRGKRIEEYVDEVAFMGARGFREWVIKEHLPPDHWQPLELLEEVNVASGLIDLIRLYNNSENSTLGQDYRRKIGQQIISTLANMELFTLVDLTKDPEEEELLNRFTRETSRAFPQSESVTLQVILDSQGKWSQSRIGTSREDQLLRAQAEARGGTITYSVRKFGPGPDAFIIFSQREKTIYSRMLKILRGRSLPITDRVAARFILGDLRYLETFLKLLSERLPGWKIQKEEAETITPASKLPYPQLKYYAYKEDKPETQIEMVIEWLADEQSIFRGSWVPYIVSEESNFDAFRMKQFLEGPLQFLSPFECYGIDWSSPEEQEILLKYANTKAIRCLSP